MISYFEHISKPFGF